MTRIRRTSMEAFWTEGHRAPVAPTPASGVPQIVAIDLAAGMDFSTIEAVINSRVTDAFALHYENTMLFGSRYGLSVSHAAGENLQNIPRQDGQRVNRIQLGGRMAGRNFAVQGENAAMQAEAAYATFARILAEYARGDAGHTMLVLDSMSQYMSEPMTAEDFYESPSLPKADRKRYNYYRERNTHGNGQHAASMLMNNLVRRACQTD